MSTVHHTLDYFFTALFVSLLAAFGMASLGFQLTFNTLYIVGKLAEYIVALIVVAVLIQFVAAAPTPLVEEVVVDDEEFLLTCAVQEEEPMMDKATVRIIDEVCMPFDAEKIQEWLESGDDDEFPDILEPEIIEFLHQTLEAQTPTVMVAVDREIEITDPPAPEPVGVEDIIEYRVPHVWELNRKIFKVLCNPSRGGPEIVLDLKGTGPRPTEAGVLTRPVSQHTGTVGPVAIPKPSEEVVSMMQKIKEMREQSEST